MNNAAGFGGGKTFDKMTYEEWDRLIRINLTGTYMFTNEVLPFMIEKQHGKICMVSSGAALGYDFSDPHYAASKAGMIGLAKELAQELARHRINVNVLGTGLTDTRMAHLPGRSWEDETRGLPWYRVGTPQCVSGVGSSRIYYRAGALSQRRRVDVAIQAGKGVTDYDMAKQSKNGFCPWI